MQARPSPSFVGITRVVFALAPCYTPQGVPSVFAVVLEKGSQHAITRLGARRPALYAFY